MTQYQFTQFEIQNIKDIVSNSNGTYWQAYGYIMLLIKSSGLPDDGTIYWLEKAAEINRNEIDSSANTFIRTYTVLGLKLDGYTTLNNDGITPLNFSGIQSISNAIGEAVVKDIVDTGLMPDRSTIVLKDVSSAIAKSGQTPLSWGGAFYYWNEVYDVSTGQTVGQYIMADKGRYEKFLINVAHTIAVTMNQEYDERPKKTAEFPDMISTFFKQSLPAEVSSDIFLRMISSASHGNSALNENSINGWEYNNNSGIWTKTTGGLTEVASGNTLSELELIKSIRLNANSILGSNLNNEVVSNNTEGGETITFTNSLGGGSSIHFNSNGIPYYTERKFADGSSEKTFYDSGNKYSWTSMSILFNKTGDISSILEEGGLESFSNISFIGNPKAFWSANQTFFGLAVSPLVIDLNGDGARFVSLQDSKAMFDLRAEGHAIHTGWVSALDGTLVRDVNGNGLIDDITELFGNGTTDGFTMLAAFDSNSDGKIDANDAVFVDLKLWIDADQDGFSLPSELHSLADFNLASISVNATATPNMTRDGNRVSHVSTVTKTDGSTAEIVDVWYTIDAAVTRKGFAVEVSAAAEALPDLIGYGGLDDLRVAMTKDAGLLAAVQAALSGVATMTSAQFEDALEAVLFEWAGAADVDPSSRNGNLGGMDARKLVTLEAFFNRAYQRVPEVHQITPYPHDPLPQDVILLNTLYNQIKSSLMPQFAATTDLSGVSATTNKYAMFSGMDFDRHTGKITEESLTAYIDANMPATNRWAYLNDLSDLLVPIGNTLLDPYYSSYIARYAARVLVNENPSTPPATLAGANVIFQGNTGASVTSSAGMDIVFLQGGNDTVSPTTSSPWNGSDVYVFRQGDGNDTIFDTASNGERFFYDTLLLLGINQDQVAIGQSANALQVLIIPTGEIITVSNQGLSNTTDVGVERIEFEDRSFWEEKDFLAKALTPGIRTGTSGDDVITGWQFVDDIRSGAGNDTLNGGAGNDMLTGGTGNDALNGGTGHDTYIYRLGDGNDTITEQISDLGGNTIFLADILPSDVTLAKSFKTLTVNINGGGSLTIANNFDYPNYQGKPIISVIKFADGTVWNSNDIDRNLQIAATKIGTAGFDYLSATNDDPTRLEGLGGNDSLSGGRSRDIIIGGPGDDTLTGNGGADVFIFNQGDGKDVINASAFFTGLLTTLQLGPGILPENVTVNQLNQSDIIFRFAGATDTITVRSEILNSPATQHTIDLVKFDSGQVWAYDDIFAKAITPTSGNDIIYGDYSANVLRGLAGNDTLYGQAGNDTLIGGLGNDTIYGGPGRDTVIFEAGDGQDTLIHETGSLGFLLDFGSGLDLSAATISALQVGGSVNVSIGFAGGDKVTLNNLPTFSANPMSNMEIVWGDGTKSTYSDIVDKILASTAGNDTIHGDYRANLLSGGDGNDILNGWNGDDRIIGGGGNDSLTGGYGTDTFAFQAGFGKDTIQDFRAYYIPDKIEFSTSLFANFSAVQSAMAQVGSDVRITYDPLNDILIKNVTMASLSASDFNFI